MVEQVSQAVLRGRGGIQELVLQRERTRQEQIRQATISAARQEAQRKQQAIEAQRKAAEEQTRITTRPGTFQVTVIDRGGGRTPQTLSVVRTFPTEEAARTFAREERIEFASDPNIPVGVRPTPSVAEARAKPRLPGGQEITGPAPKGKPTTRTAAEQIRIREKAKVLAEISKRQREGQITTTEAQRLRIEVGKPQVKVERVPTLIKPKPPKPIVEPKLTTGGVPLTLLGIPRRLRIEPKVKVKPREDLFGGIAITAAPPPIGIIETTAMRLARRREELRLSRIRGEIQPLEEAKVGLAIPLVGAARFGKELIERPIPTAKAIVTGLGEVGRRIITGVGFPTVGPAIRAEPGIAAGVIAGEVLFLKGAGQALRVGARAAELGITRISPGFRGITTTAFGERIIPRISRAEEGTFELGLIPGGARPTLPVEAARAAREAIIPIKPFPKIPKVTQLQRRILDVAIERGDAVTGSFGQKILVTGSRKFGDIDIVTKNPKGTAEAIKKAVGKNVEIQKVEITDSPLGSFNIFRVIDKKTGKVIADIDPIKFAEEGFATKFPPIKVGDLTVISPRARLAAKVAQLGRGKVKSGKVTIDIQTLSGGQFVPSPLTRGAFGFTRAEQAELIGRRGVVTTSARDFFTAFKPTVEIQPGPSGLGLFATPSDPRTGRALTRVTRLVLEEKEATITDILQVM